MIITKMNYKWVKLPVLVLPEEIAGYLSESDLFLPYKSYPGRKEYVLKKLIRGELGIWCGYRIVVKQKKATK